jgi:hypothetical protein
VRDIDPADRPAQGAAVLRSVRNPAMTEPALKRRVLNRRVLLRLAPALLLPGVLAACGEDGAGGGGPSSPGGTYPEPSYSFLTPLQLNVARVDIDDSWTPRGAARRVEHLAPYPPRYTLKRMAEDRLVPVGRTGRAVFVIDDASIVRAPRHYEASLAVRVDITDDEGTLLGKATARVAQVRPITGDSARAERDELYAFVRDLMGEMNVEFEYQVKQSMKDALQGTSEDAPAAPGVDSQTLDSPETTVAPASDDGPAVPLSVDPDAVPEPATPAAAPSPAPTPPPAEGAPRAPTPLRPPP